MTAAETLVALLDGKAKPEALEVLLCADDPLDWIARAVNNYARKQTNRKKYKETRTYADRKEYLKQYQRDRRAREASK